jgi:hypothetical protein
LAFSVIFLTFLLNSSCFSTKLWLNELILSLFGSEFTLSFNLFKKVSEIFDFSKNASAVDFTLSNLSEFCIEIRIFEVIKI